MTTFLPPNEERIALEKIPWTVRVEGPEKKALVYRGGHVIGWKVVAN